MNAAIGRTRAASLASIAAIKGRTTAIGQMASGSRLAAMQSRMLLFQLNDIGVSLAGGMSPLMVLVQQGSQITQMYAGQGGVNAALRQTADLAKGAVAGVGSAARGVLGLARAHPVLTAAVAVAAAGLAGLRHEINATAETQVSYGDVTLAVWQSIRDGAVALVKPAFDAIAAWAAPAFAAVASAAAAAWDGIVAGVHVTGNAIVKAYGVVCETIGALFAAVPSAVGAAVAASANAVLAGVEWLINRVSGTLNAWIAKVNDTLGMLPDWMRPDWARIPAIPGDVRFGRYENPYAEDLAGRWRDYTGAVGGIVRSDPLGDVFRDVSARAEANARARAASGADDGIAPTAGGSGGGGRSGGATAEDLRAVEQAELAGIDAIRDALGRAYEDVKDLGKGIGETLVGAFRSAEEAVGDFVRTGKLDVKSLVSSILVDFAQLAARKFLFAPLSAALSGALGGGGLFGGLFGAAASTVAATVSHAGGMAGAGPLRIVEAAAFLRAPRLHAGTPSWLAGRRVRDDPAARRAGAEPARRPRPTSGGTSGRRRSSTCMSATPRASGSRAPRSRATSPGRSPSVEEGCEPWPSTRSGFRTTSAAAPAAARSGARRSSSSPPATRSATPPGRTRGGATTPPTASAAPTISPRSSPSSRRGTAGCTASAGRTGATTGPACRRRR